MFQSGFWMMILLLLVRVTVSLVVRGESPQHPRKLLLVLVHISLYILTLNIWRREFEVTTKNLLDRLKETQTL